MNEQEQAYHKAQMVRLLIALIDNREISHNIGFKGGTCARMLGYLDRFSVDLDFDLLAQKEKKNIRKSLHDIFQNLEFEIKDESQKALQFFLKYEASGHQRNTLKLEILDKKFKNNRYQPQYLKEINRYAICQTVETLFANKLVAVMDRFEQSGHIAGRDIYDIHYFFFNGYKFNPELITERRKIQPGAYLKKLRQFIQENVTQKLIDQDLNILLLYNKFVKIRKSLKSELLMFLN